MRTSSLIAAAAVFGVGVRSAQLNGLPDCAKPCVAKYTSGANVGGCNSLDIHCICSNNDFLGGIACCLAGACDATGIDTAITYAKNICTTANPPVEVPDEVVCSSTTAGSPAPTVSGATTAGGGGATQSGSESATTTGGGATTPAPTTPTESSSTNAAPSSTSSGAAMMNVVGGSGVGLVGGIAAALVLL